MTHNQVENKALKVIPKYNGWVNVHIYFPSSSSSSFSHLTHAGLWLLPDVQQLLAWIARWGEEQVKQTHGSVLQGEKNANLQIFLTEICHSEWLMRGDRQ